MKQGERSDFSVTKRIVPRGPRAVTSRRASTSLEVGADFGRRYRILEVLGEGGMGMVYRAYDKELDREVALKLIKPSVSREARALERFKREILLASKITHKHVLRIHDLGDVDGIKYISMNYIEGEDLKKVIDREGALPAQRVVRLVKQLCQALKAAHEVGVLHRDLKPQNVMIDKQDNAYITDFGLARSLEMSEEESLTATGAVIGTPLYMSPEQIKGEPSDKRTDLYSLGLVVYQMLTGEFPFAVTSGYDALFKRINRKPRDPKDVNPSIPDYLAGIVMKCVEPNPNLRYQDAAEVLEDLDARRTRWPVRNLVQRALSWRGVIVLALLIVTLLALWWLPRQGSEFPLDSQGAPPTVLAVLPMENATGDAASDWMSLGLMDLVIVDLRESKQLRPVSGERLFQILRGLQLRQRQRYDSATINRIAQFSGANMILTGRISKHAQALHVDAFLRDMASRRDVPIHVEARGDLLSLVEDLARSVQKRMQLPASPAEKEAAKSLRQVATRSGATLQSYYRGVMFLYRGDSVKAAGQLQQAVKQDPGFALAYANLARSYDKLGRVEQAEKFMHKALALAALPAYERYQMQATQARIADDDEAAIKAYRQLLAAYPNDPAGYADLGAVFYDMGEWDQALENGRKALELDPQSVYTLMELGRAELRRGNPQTALRYLTEARALKSQLQGDQEQAVLLNILGFAYQRLGYHESALEHYRKSLDIKKRTGDRSGVAATLGNMAMVYQEVGRYDDARRSYQQALDISRQINDQASTGRHLNNLGVLAERAGQYAAALDYYTQGLHIARTRGVRAEIANRLNNIGWVYYLQGRYIDAATYYQLALKETDRAPDRMIRADTLSAYGNLMADQGANARAMKYYTEALDLRRDTQDHTGLASTLADVAHCYNLLGAFQSAEESLQQAQTFADEVENKELSAYVLLYRGETLRLQGDVNLAQRWLTQARQLAEDSKSRTAILMAEIEMGSLYNQLPQVDRSLPLLRRAVKEADNLGLRPLLVRARLELARAYELRQRTAEALREIKLATTLAERLRLPEALLQGHFLAGRIYQTRTQLGRALRHYRRALEAVDGIRQQAGADHAVTFMRRPDVQALLRQAAEAFKAAGRGQDFTPFSRWLS